MHVHPELIIIRKLNDLLKKYKAMESIPTTDVEAIYKDLQEMIEQERNYSQLYLLQTDRWVEQKG